MKKKLFVSILEGALPPFTEVAYPDGHKFMTDNDPKHTSGYAADWMREIQQAGVRPLLSPPLLKPKSSISF